MKLIATLPYCQKDHEQATRLLKWIQELDDQVDHHLLLVADDAVPTDTKKAIHALGKSIFTSAETILVKAPAPVGNNYHPAAAVMFDRAAAHIDACYKFNWLWLEPDAVPLVPAWLNMLSFAYECCPKRFLGPMATLNQKDLPAKVMFATAIYPNCAHEELKRFCGGERAFDMGFSDYVVPRGDDTPLIFHRFGTPTEVPTFKETKMATDGPNVGDLSSIPKEAVLFHRNKDGTLINLLTTKRQRTAEELVSVFEKPTQPSRSHLFQRKPTTV